MSGVKRVIAIAVGCAMLLVGCGQTEAPRVNLRATTTTAEKSTPKLRLDTTTTMTLDVVVNGSNAVTHKYTARQGELKRTSTWPADNTQKSNSTTLDAGQWQSLLNTASSLQSGNHSASCTEPTQRTATVSSAGTTTTMRMTTCAGQTPASGPDVTALDSLLSAFDALLPPVASPTQPRDPSCPGSLSGEQCTLVAEAKYWVDPSTCEATEQPLWASMASVFCDPAARTAKLDGSGARIYLARYSALATMKGDLEEQIRGAGGNPASLGTDISTAPAKDTYHYSDAPKKNVGTVVSLKFADNSLEYLWTVDESLMLFVTVMRGGTSASLNTWWKSDYAGAS